MNSKKIICIGTAIVDCIIKGYDPKPVSQGRFLAESTVLSPGGEAVNESVTMAKLGADPHIVCLLTGDPASSILKSELDKYGVNTDHVIRYEQEKTPVTVMFIDDKGERNSITNEAHKFNFHPEKDMSYMEGASAVVLGSLFRAPFNDKEVILKVVSEAKRSGLKVYADTKLPNFNPLTLEDIRESLPFIDCIFPNESEAKYYTGETDPEKMVDTFLEFGVKNVIIKLGDKGCLFKNNKEIIRLDACKVDAVDATGAGDTFIAGFVVRKSEGASDRDALIFANACGAICSTQVGAVSALKDYEQVKNMIETM